MARRITSPASQEQVELLRAESEDLAIEPSTDSKSQRNFLRGQESRASETMKQQAAQTAEARRLLRLLLSAFTEEAKDFCCSVKRGPSVRDPSS